MTQLKPAIGYVVSPGSLVIEKLVGLTLVFCAAAAVAPATLALDELAVGVLERGLVHAGLDHVGELHVADGAVGRGDRLRDGLVAAAADAYRPADRLRVADLGLPLRSRPCSGSR